MADIFRRLDELAGVAGGVVSGERARKDQLLQDHLGRSQQRYLQQQRQTGMRQLQKARFDRQQSMLAAKLRQDKSQFETREERLGEEHKADMVHKADELAAMKARNLTAQSKVERDNVSRQIGFINTNIEQLNDQIRNAMVSNQNEMGVLSEDGKALVNSLKAQKNDLMFKHREMQYNFADPAIQDVLREAESVSQRARIRAVDEQQKRLDYWTSRPYPGRPSEYGNRNYNIHNTTYKVPKGTEADEKLPIGGYEE